MRVSIRMLCVVVLSSLALIITGCAAIVPVTAASAGVAALDSRSFGDIVDDSVIVTKVYSELSAGSFKQMFIKIGVISHEGRVLLTGNVKEEEYANEAVRKVWTVKGVREVIDEIVVSAHDPKIAKDIWISGKLKTAFLVEKNFDSLNYKYDVSDNVVYLIGVADNAQEREKAIDIASKTEGVKKVVSHIILKKDKRRISNQK